MQGCPELRELRKLRKHSVADGEMPRKPTVGSSTVRGYLICMSIFMADFCFLGSFFRAGSSSAMSIDVDLYVSNVVLGVSGRIMLAKIIGTLSTLNRIIKRF